MIRLTEAQHRSLKQWPEREVVITIPPRDPKPGATKAKPPVIVGHAYQAKATIRVGEEVVRREMRVTVDALVEQQDGSWAVTILAHDRTDPPRFMARTGGDLDTPGYTASVSRALDPDAPCVPEHIQRKWSQQAFERDELLRAQRIAKARAGVDALWGGGRDEKRAAREMEHHLQRLEAIDESEAA